MSLGGPFMSFNHGSWLNWLRERERERERERVSKEGIKNYF